MTLKKYVLWDRQTGDLAEFSECYFRQDMCIDKGNKHHRFKPALIRKEEARKFYTKLRNEGWEIHPDET